MRITRHAKRDERLFRWQRLEIEHRCRYEPSETMFDRYPAPSLGARRVLRMAFLIEITLEDIVSLSLSLSFSLSNDATAPPTLIRDRPCYLLVWTPPAIKDLRSIDRSIPLSSSPRPSFSAFDRSIFEARVKTWSTLDRAKKKEEEEKNEVFHHLGTRYIVRGALKESFSYP